MHKEEDWDYVMYNKQVGYNYDITLDRVMPWSLASADKIFTILINAKTHESITDSTIGLLSGPPPSDVHEAQFSISVKLTSNSLTVSKRGSVWFENEEWNNPDTWRDNETVYDNYENKDIYITYYAGKINIDLATPLVFGPNRNAEVVLPPGWSSDPSTWDYCLWPMDPNHNSYITIFKHNFITSSHYSGYVNYIKYRIGRV